MESEMESLDFESENTENSLNIETMDYTVEELLISCVLARPALWDSRMPLRERSKTVREQLWIEIFKEFGENPEFSIEFLMKKWRNLRDTYVRIKGEYTPSGSGSSKKKKWEYFDSLQFLNDTISYKPTVSNVSLTSGIQSSSSSPILSPDLTPTGAVNSTGKPTKSKHKNDKVEDAILSALNKINSGTCSPEGEVPVVNPICIKISELLQQMPQRQRTLLEIKLLQTAYEGAETYL